MVDTSGLKLHPQYRLLLLLLIALLLPQSSMFSLVLIHVWIASACLVIGTLSEWLRATLRLKWLFISIAVLYGWFTPGLPLFEVAGVNMPTQEGLVFALHRSLLLSALVAAVMWLVKPLPATQISQALTALLVWLRFFRVEVNVFSKRLALTLAAVSRIQADLQRHQFDGWLLAAGNVLLRIEKGDLGVDIVSPDNSCLQTPNALELLVFLFMVLGLFVLFWAPRMLLAV